MRPVISRTKVQNFGQEVGTRELVDGDSDMSTFPRSRIQPNQVDGFGDMVAERVGCRSNILGDLECSLFSKIVVGDTSYNGLLNYGRLLGGLLR